MSFPSPEPYDEIANLRRQLNEAINATRYSMPLINSSFPLDGAGGSSINTTNTTLNTLFAINPVIHTIQNTDQITLQSSSVIVDDTGSTLNLKTINGTLNNGQIIYVKPKAGKTLVLKSGGNINIGADITIPSGVVALLQYHEDDGNKYDVVSISGSSGIKWSDVIIDINKDMQNKSLENLDFISFNVTSGVGARIEGGNNVIDFSVQGVVRGSLSKGTTAGFEGTTVFEIFGVPLSGYSDINPVASLKLVSNDATPTVDQLIGQIAFDAANSIGQRKTFAQIDTYMANVTNGSEDAYAFIRLMRNGTMTSVMQLIGDAGTTPQIRMFGNLNMNNNTIIGLNDILFQESGQSILSDTTGLQFLVPTGDEFQWLINGVLKLKLNNTGLLLSTSIDMESNSILDVGSIAMSDPNMIINDTSNIFSINVGSTQAIELQRGGNFLLRLSGSTILKSDTIVSLMVTGTGDKITFNDGTTDRIFYDWQTDDFYPLDQQSNLGRSTNRWFEVFAVIGTINTSFTRFKKDIVDVDPSKCLEICKALKPIKYKIKMDSKSEWKDKKKEQKTKNSVYFGFAADPLETLMPEACSKDELGYNGGVYLHSVIAAACGAIAELDKRLKILEKQQDKN
jgi:hypothetical protein